MSNNEARFAVQRQTLSDGSHAYNVVGNLFGWEGEERVYSATFAATNEREANELAERLNNTAWIEIDELEA